MYYPQPSAIAIKFDEILFFTQQMGRTYIVSVFTLIVGCAYSIKSSCSCRKKPFKILFYLILFGKISKSEIKKDYLFYCFY